jgi:hypothetical protein
MTLHHVGISGYDEKCITGFTQKPEGRNLFGDVDVTSENTAKIGLKKDGVRL